jgi:hypothetical protein
MLFLLGHRQHIGSQCVNFNSDAVIVADREFIDRCVSRSPDNRYCAPNSAGSQRQKPRIVQGECTLLKNCYSWQEETVDIAKLKEFGDQLIAVYPHCPRRLAHTWRVLVRSVVSELLFFDTPKW